MKMKLSRSHLLQLVPCLMVVMLLQGAGLCFAEKRTRLIEFEEIAEVDREVRSCMLIVSRPQDLDLDGVDVLWLTARHVAHEQSPIEMLTDSMRRAFGHGERLWTTSRMEALKHWVARGHVMWVDTALAQQFGIANSVGGAVRVAVVAEGAEEHPLVEGIERIECQDVFHYMRGLPSDAQAILTEWNRADHVVLASWLLGKGMILFRPEQKRELVTWCSGVERAWVEPDVADGRRLLHNINLYTISVLARAHRWPPGREVRGPTPLLEAFGGIGGG